MIRSQAAGAAIVAVAKRPDLWVTGVQQLFLLAPRGWYRQWPPLPLPDSDYLAFRFETAYGKGSTDPEPQDVIAYLSWCRRNRP